MTGRHVQDVPSFSVVSLTLSYIMLMQEFKTSNQLRKKLPRRCSESTSKRCRRGAHRLNSNFHGNEGVDVSVSCVYYAVNS